MTSCHQGVHLITAVIPWLLTPENSGVLGRCQAGPPDDGDEKNPFGGFC